MKSARSLKALSSNDLNFLTRVAKMRSFLCCSESSSTFILFVLKMGEFEEFYLSLYIILCALREYNEQKQGVRNRSCRIGSKGLVIIYGTSWWIIEFNLDNNCDNHNHYTIKILISPIVYSSYNNIWCRGRDSKCI
ncbi:MAG: hypothetical protein M3044_19415 [Thermoproteota archaeon]|nr:hypothetical protein [Thermoproteota archaeon]